MKLSDVFRQVPGGAAVADNTVVTIRRHSDDADVSDPDPVTSGGVWSYQTNLNPHGQVYWEGTATVGSVTTTRKGSSKASSQVGPLSLAELPFVLAGLGDGVTQGYANELAVTATGTRQVSVNTGAALVGGVPCVIYAAASPATAGSSPSGDRTDCLVIEVNTDTSSASYGKSELKIIEGATAATVSRGTLATGFRRLPLADLALVGAGDTSYTVTDRRTYLGTLMPRSAVVAGVGRKAQTDTTVTSITGTSLSDLAVNLSLASGIIYDIVARATVLGRSTGAAQAQMSVFVNGTANASPYVGTTGTTALPLVNAHTVTGVVGTGGSISCGVQVKRSSTSGDAVFSSGMLLVTAIPRN